MIKHCFLMVAAAGALAACSPKDYESPPVTVNTPQGPVVCQLYTKDIVEWDRAISRPNSMGVAEADAVCIEEGKREQRG